MIQIIGNRLNQWDVGRLVQVTGEASHVHFANQGDSKAVIIDVEEGKAKIPDYLLQTGKTLLAYAVLNGVTLESYTFAVRKRERPENYVYEEDQRNFIYTLITNAENATAAASAAAESANKATENARQASAGATAATLSANTAANNATAAADSANRAATQAAHTAKSLMVVGEAKGEVIALNDAIDQFLVGCRIFGKTTQDGTPTPDAPVELVSVGDVGSISVTVAEKNLWNGKFENIAFGSSEETGPVVTILSYPKYKSIVVPVIPGGKYSFSRGNAIWSGLYIAFTHDYPTLHTKLIFEDGNTTTYLSPYNKGTALEIPGITVPDDCYYMVVYLTNNSDTYDVTNTWYQVEAGETVTGCEPHNGQTITISTPNGLPGIPVTTGGNYTDASGQQWICDEIDLARGVYVQRLIQRTISDFSSANSVAPKNGHTEGYISFGVLVREDPGGLCDKFPYAPAGSFPRFGLGGSIIYFTIEGEYTKEEWIDQLTAISPTFVAALRTPIETTLSEEELAAYATLHTYRGNTTVSNDAGAWMDLEYVMDAKKYIDSLVSAPIPRLATITLSSASWTGSNSLYSQVVTIPGITKYSKVDLLPSVEQLAIFHNKDVAFTTENVGGVVTVYAIGDKPLLDYTMQVQITEVIA